MSTKSLDSLAFGTLPEVDQPVADLIEREGDRQSRTFTLIASENYAPEAVLEASRSVFTNKYSEGYPGKRYYEGQQCVDPLEQLAIDRACEVFGVEHANVQPYSGSPANLAVYLALAEPGDKIMGMALPDGGHLTHGWGVSVTGKWFTPVRYGVRLEDGLVDMDEVREIALRERPKLIFCGGTAIPRIIDFEAFAEIAKEAEAVLVADIAHIAGLVAGGAHPSPAPHADVITTTTHKTLRGPRGAMVMCREQYAKDIDRAVFPGLQGGPHNHTTAGIAVALELARQPEFAEYAHQIVANSKALAAALVERGYDLVTGGSDNHLILMDLQSADVGGKPVAQGLDRAGLTTNYNTVPGDPRPPFDPSGIRLGTGAVTTRGLREADMDRFGDWIDRGIRAVRDGNEAELERMGAEVAELANSLPVPGARL